MGELVLLVIPLRKSYEDAQVVSAGHYTDACTGELRAQLIEPIC